MDKPKKNPIYSNINLLKIKNNFGKRNFNLAKTVNLKTEKDLNLDIVKSLTAHTLEIVSCFSYSLLRSHDCCPFLYLSADPDGNADDHGGDGDAGDEGDPHGSPHQGAQLPQDLLLPAPRLLAPERAAGGTVEGERERTGIHLPPY